MDAYCQTCQADREIQNPRAITLNNDKPATRGDCPACGGKIYRIGESPEGVPSAETRKPTCFCGITIAEANRLCTEMDCFHRR